MSFNLAIVCLTQLSCILSVVGSFLVAVTWGFPIENRQKHGRILLLWLSFADCVSSLVYFIQTLDFEQGETFCKVMALLGIYFPVASFLWTDFIALYLYQAVVNRTSQMEWKHLLRLFHVVAWCVSGMIILFVGVFDHAGRASNEDGSNDDIGSSNTGGWCWISGKSSTERFIWEMIGGKIIEWLSCFIILPYLYTSVSCHLKHIDKNAATVPAVFPKDTLRNNSVFLNSSPFKFNTPTSKTQSNRTVEGKPATAVKSNITFNQLNNISENNQTNNISNINTPNSTVSSPTRTVNVGYKDSFSAQDGASLPYTPPRAKYACEEESFDARVDEEGNSNMSDSYLASNHNMIYSPPITPIVRSDDIERSNNNGHTLSTRPSSADQHDSQSQQVKTPKKVPSWRTLIVNRFRGNSEWSGTTNGTSGNTRGFFTKFYVKLSALPLVFFFIRIWGTIHVVLQATGYDNREVNRFFAVMQAFFDPSQGFFNAILFVFLSAEDRSNLLISLAMLCKSIAQSMPCCCKDWSSLFASPRALLRYRKRANTETARLNGVVADTGNIIEGTNILTQSLGNRSGSFGDLSISDYECEEGERISDFSFESRLESIY